MNNFILRTPLSPISLNNQRSTAFCEISFFMISVGVIILCTYCRQYLFGYLWLQDLCCSSWPRCTLCELSKLHTISIQYSGTISIQYSGTISIQYSGTISIQYSGTISIQYSGTISIQYSGTISIQYSGTISIQYSGTISIQYSGFPLSTS